MIIGQLKINYLRNKFDCLVQKFARDVDILMVSETKPDNNFPVGQFLIYGYSPPIRIDRDIHEGGLMLFVKEDIPCKLLSLENKPMEGFYKERNLRKTKWLRYCSYNPRGSNVNEVIRAVLNLSIKSIKSTKTQSSKSNKSTKSTNSTKSIKSTKLKQANKRLSSP